MAVKERDPHLCAAGSFFFPGLGQVYCGRILRGIIFLIPAVLLTFPYGFFYLFVHLGQVPAWWPYWTSLITPVSQTTDFVVRVIATCDAYRVAKLTKE